MSRPAAVAPATQPDQKQALTCFVRTFFTGIKDERGLTPLFWSHVLPYREVKLDMNTRLALTKWATAQMRIDPVAPLAKTSQPQPK